MKYTIKMKDDVAYNLLFHHFHTMHSPGLAIYPVNSKGKGGLGNANILKSYKKKLCNYQGH